MKNCTRYILAMFFWLTGVLTVSSQENVAAPVDSLGQEVQEEAKAFNPKETIFEHLGDEYGWSCLLYTSRCV